RAEERHGLAREEQSELARAPERRQVEREHARRPTRTPLLVQRTRLRDGQGVGRQMSRGVWGLILHASLWCYRAAYMTQVRTACCKRAGISSRAQARLNIVAPARYR